MRWPYIYRLAARRTIVAHPAPMHGWPAAPDDWITTAALSFIGAGIILPAGIRLRWPFALKTREKS